MLIEPNTEKYSIDISSCTREMFGKGTRYRQCWFENEGKDGGDIMRFTCPQEIRKEKVLARCVIDQRLIVISKQDLRKVLLSSAQRNLKGKLVDQDPWPAWRQDHSPPLKCQSDHLNGTGH